MPGYYKRASALPISVIQRAVLEQIVQRHTSQQCHVKRASILLVSSEGMSIYRSERAPECPPQDSLFLAKEVASSPRTPHLDRSRSRPTGLIGGDSIHAF